MTIRVELGQEVRPGYFAYRVCRDAVTVLESVSHQPLLDACRKIKRMGDIHGNTAIGLWRPGKHQPDATCSLDWGASHTVSETVRSGPRFVKWVPDPRWKNSQPPKPK